MIKKLFASGTLLTLIAPAMVFAAFNDVTLTTAVTLTSNSISLAVYGSSAVLESIVVSSGSFNVTLASGSSVEIRSTDRKVMEVSHANYLTTNVCNTAESRIRLENSGVGATITVTPSSATCQGFANTASGGNLGGPAPACEDSIDNDKDGLIDVKDPGCENAADTDETNAAPVATTSATTTITPATATSTETTATVSPPAATQTAAAGVVSQEIMNLVNQLQSLMMQLKSLGGTVSPSLEATILSLTSTPASSGAFTRDLKVGTARDDVKMLQAFLNTHGYPVASQGPGSPGNETIVFGAATRSALIKFQKANDITPAAGYFGPKTRALVNSMQ